MLKARHGKVAVTLAKKNSRNRTNGVEKKPSVRTLAIDIGGTGLKALVLDESGEPLTERVRIPTPHPANPASVVTALVKLVKPLHPFDRVSVGFPGVVVNGTTRTAPNLGGGWKNFALAASLERRLERPTRVLNDAGVQGYGVITGEGVEMVITLGTGMGCALYIDGKYVPNLELAHHPFKGKKTYEDYIGARALEKVGKKAWNKRVLRVLEQIDPIWNPRRIYVGGGNAKYLRLNLPHNVRVTDNVAGLLGGIALWENAN